MRGDRDGRDSLVLIMPVKIEYQDISIDFAPVPGNQFVTFKFQFSMRILKKNNWFSSAFLYG